MDVKDQVQSGIFVCPGQTRHYFKEVRSKAKQPGPPFFFFLRCSRCTALLEQMVYHKADQFGNVTPALHSYILISGRRIPVDSHIYRLIQAEVVKPEAQETPAAATPSLNGTPG